VSRGPLFCTLPEVSCVTPRGKHDLEFYPGALVFRPKSAAGVVVEVPRRDVTGVFYLVTKEQVMLVLALGKPALIGKTLHSVLAVVESAEALRKAAAAAAKRNAAADGGGGPVPPAFRVPLQSPAAGMRFKEPTALDGLLEAPTAGLGSGALFGDSSVAVLRALAAAVWGRVGEADPALFKSAAPGGGAAFIRAYLGVNDGLLFPLRRAFVFVGKPLLVLPHARIGRTEVGRAGASLRWEGFMHACYPRCY